MSSSGGTTKRTDLRRRRRDLSAGLTPLAAAWPLESWPLQACPLEAWLLDMDMDMPVGDESRADVYAAAAVGDETRSTGDGATMTLLPETLLSKTGEEQEEEDDGHGGLGLLSTLSASNWGRRNTRAANAQKVLLSRPKSPCQQCARPLYWLRHLRAT